MKMRKLANISWRRGQLLCVKMDEADAYFRCEGGFDAQRLA